ncbi:hypothetical protein TeGR_g337, partial [Tetraparma gracilis]
PPPPRRSAQDVVTVHETVLGSIAPDRSSLPDFTIDHVTEALKELGGGYCQQRLTFPPLLAQLFVHLLYKLVYKNVEGANNNNESSSDSDSDASGDASSASEEEEEEEEEAAIARRKKGKQVPEPEEVDERYLQLSYFEDIVSPITWPDVLVHHLETQQYFHQHQVDVNKEERGEIHAAKVQFDTEEDDEEMDYGDDSDDEEGGGGGDDEEVGGGAAMMSIVGGAGGDDGGYIGTGAAYKGYAKLKKQEPWMLTPKECLSLLRVLADDLLSKCMPEELNRRVERFEELLKAKKKADFGAARARKTYETYGGENAAKAEEEKEKEEEEEEEEDEGKKKKGGKKRKGADEEEDDGKKKKGGKKRKGAAAEEEEEGGKKKKKGAKNDEEDDKKGGGKKGGKKNKAAEEDEEDDDASQISQQTEGAEGAEGEKKKGRSRIPKNIPTLEEVETAEKEAKIANDAYLKGLKREVYRHQELGQDRDYNKYWHFDSCPKFIFVEKARNNEAQEWTFYSMQSEFDGLVASLDERGERESKLKENLVLFASIRKKMLDDTKEEREAAQRKVQEEKLRKKLADAEAAAELKARLAEAAGRRSTRVTSESGVDIVAQLKSELAAHLKPPLVKEERELGPEELRLKRTGALSCLEFDNGYRTRKPHEQPEYVVGEVNTECKATMMMNTSGVKCIVDEVLHAETELEQFSPMGDEKARATWRRRLGEISDDYQRQLAGGMALGTVKSVAPYIRRLKEPVLDLEQRMFDVLGMAFFSECEDACSKIVFPEEEESDDESDAEMEVDDEVDEEAFEFMSDSAMAVSCSLQVKDRKMWRAQVKSADTVGKISSLLFGFLREFGDYLYAMNEGKEEAVEVLKNWGAAPKKGKKGGPAVGKEGMRLMSESEPVRNKLWWAKVSLKLPCWPVHEHTVSDSEIATLLAKNKLTVVSMVGGMVEGQEGKKGSEGGELLIVNKSKVLDMWEQDEEGKWNMVRAPDHKEEDDEEEEEEGAGEGEEGGGGKGGDDKKKPARASKGWARKPGRNAAFFEAAEVARRKALEKATLKAKKLMVGYAKELKKVAGK